VVRLGKGILLDQALAGPTAASCRFTALVR
jgi:hypothetical protein